MKFVQFIENKYQEVHFKTMSTTEYDIVKDAEIKALHETLARYRTLLKWLHVPKVFYNYVQVQLGFTPEPKPVLVDKIKEQKEAEDLKRAQETQANVVSINPGDSAG
jgi:hypothetical protein